MTITFLPPPHTQAQHTVDRVSAPTAGGGRGLGARWRVISALRLLLCDPGQVTHSLCTILICKMRLRKITSSRVAMRLGELMECSSSVLAGTCGEGWRGDRAEHRAFSGSGTVLCDTTMARV